MITEPSRRVAESDFPPAAPIPSIPDALELSPQMRTALLDFDAWGEILATYGRTMRVAVALTDVQGKLLGNCHNEQPVWSLVHSALPNLSGGCPFCLTTRLPCTAVADAFQAGGAVMVRDQAGLTHVAVPLLLGTQRLGAIIAGQVFFRYPEQLQMQRAAKEFGVSAHKLWDVARKQVPVSSAGLRTSGDLLFALGQAFLQQRYAAILETTLAETNARFRSLVEGVRDYALFTVDLTGSVTSWNPGAKQMLGYSEREIVGRNFSCIFPGEDVQNGLPEKLLRDAQETGGVATEGWRVRADSIRFWASVNITTLRGEEGFVYGFVIIMQDVTQRMKVAIGLEENRQERGRLQAKFLSHVSHELRTPLTAIYFFTTNVLDGIFGDLNPEQREHLTLAIDNVNQLKNMVSDLLDITRVDTHKLVVEPQHANPQKLIAEALNTCRKNAEVKSISLSSVLSAGLPFVWADPARVRQILTNLIDNAIKFTLEGGTISVEARPFTEDNGFLCLSVSDTGCGISDENSVIVFDRLAQVKSGAEASRSGLGLGLFIARELVNQHGGRMWLESQLGIGSTFYFTLPLFSLAGLCAPVFAAPNLEAGCVTLITVDIVAGEGGIQTEILPDIRRILERCIHLGNDVLLPSMNDAETAGTFFIVACANPGGFAVIASRIERELQNYDIAAGRKSVISSTTLRVAPGQSREEQIAEVSARIERSIEAHLVRKEIK